MAKITPIAAKTGKAKTAAAPAAKKIDRVRVYGPVGRILYPHLVEPNSQGLYPSGKYQCDILFPKSTWKEDGKEMRMAVLKVARQFFGNPKLTLEEFANPFKDGDDKEQDVFHGSIIMTPKSQFAPTVVGPDRKEFSSERIRLIKGGDYIRPVLSVYPYTQSGGGVTCGLDVVQFAREGEAIGGGRGAALELLEELEVELEDPTQDDDTSEDAMEESFVDDDEDDDTGIRI